MNKFSKILYAAMALAMAVCIRTLVSLNIRKVTLM